MIDWKDLRKEILKDPKVKRSYDDLEPEFKLIESVIEKRIQKGLTQKQLADRVGTKQSAISRLESGTYNPSFAFLKKVAFALGGRLRVTLS